MNNDDDESSDLKGLGISFVIIVGFMIGIPYGMTLLFPTWSKLYTSPYLQWRLENTLPFIRVKTVSSGCITPRSSRSTFLAYKEGH